LVYSGEIRGYNETSGVLSVHCGLNCSTGVDVTITCEYGTWSDVVNCSTVCGKCI